MLPNFAEPSIVAFYVILFVVVVLALWRGGAPERLGVGALALTLLLQIVGHSIAPPKFMSVDAVGLLIDLVAILCFGTIALFAHRTWPMLATSMLCVGGVAHLARFGWDYQMSGYAYVLMIVLPTASTILFLGIGTIRHMIRVSRDGHDPDWTNFRYNSDAGARAPHFMRET